MPVSNCKETAWQRSSWVVHCRRHGPACWRLIPHNLFHLASDPSDLIDQTGLDTLAEQSGYASFVIGNEGEVNKMFAKKEVGEFG